MPLSSVWRRDRDADRVLDEEDLRAAERNKRGATLLGIVAVLGILGSYRGAGLGGLVVSLSVTAVGVLLAAAVGVPAGPAGRVPRRRRRPLASFDEAYPTFAQVSEALSWARVSPRHYDLVTRPLLVRLMSSRLADHHGVDVRQSPGAARELVGEDVWWWLDPGRAAVGSSQPPGVDVRTLTRLVDRLETL